MSSATFCEKNLGVSMIFKNRFVKGLLGFWFFGFLISSVVDARVFLHLYGGVVTFETENLCLFGPFFLVGLYLWKLPLNFLSSPWTHMIAHLFSFLIRILFFFFLGGGVCGEGYIFYLNVNTNMIWDTYTSTCRL